MESVEPELIRYRPDKMFLKRRFVCSGWRFWKMFTGSLHIFWDCNPLVTKLCFKMSWKRFVYKGCLRCFDTFPLKCIRIRAEKSKSLIWWKRRKGGKRRKKAEKADLVMPLAFWQTCQNGIKCHEMTKCLHFGSGSCIRTYLLFVTDTTDGVCVKKTALCKFLKI